MEVRRTKNINGHPHPRRGRRQKASREGREGLGSFAGSQHQQHTDFDYLAFLTHGAVRDIMNRVNMTAPGEVGIWPTGARQQLGHQPFDIPSIQELRTKSKLLQKSRSYGNWAIFSWCSGLLAGYCGGTAESAQEHQYLFWCNELCLNPETGELLTGDVLAGDAIVAEEAAVGDLAGSAVSIGDDDLSSCQEREELILDLSNNPVAGEAVTAHESHDLRPLGQPGLAHSSEEEAQGMMAPHDNMATAGEAGASGTRLPTRKELSTKADDVQEWMFEGHNGSAVTSLKGKVPEDRMKWAIRSWLTNGVVEGFTGKHSQAKAYQHMFYMNEVRPKEGVSMLRTSGDVSAEEIAPSDLTGGSVSICDTCTSRASPAEDTEEIEQATIDQDQAASGSKGKRKGKLGLPVTGQPQHHHLNVVDEWSLGPPLPPLPRKGSGAMSAAGLATASLQGCLPGEQQQRQQLSKASTQARKEAPTGPQDAGSKMHQPERDALKAHQAAEGEGLLKVGGVVPGDGRTTRGVGKSGELRKKSTTRKATGSEDGHQIVGAWHSNGDFSCLTGGTCSRSPGFMTMCMGCYRVLRTSFRFGGKAGARSTRRGPPPQSLKLFDEVDFLHDSGDILPGIVMALSPAPALGDPKIPVEDKSKLILPEGFPDDHALITYTTRGRNWLDAVSFESIAVNPREETAGSATNTAKPKTRSLKSPK